MKGIDDMNVQELKVEMNKRMMTGFSKLKLMALRSKLKEEVNNQRLLSVVKRRKITKVEVIESRVVEFVEVGVKVEQVEERVDGHEDVAVEVEMVEV